MRLLTDLRWFSGLKVVDHLLCRHPNQNKCEILVKNYSELVLAVRISSYRSSVSSCTVSCGYRRNGVRRNRQLTAFDLSTSAPCESSNSIIFQWPLDAAECSAVEPCCMWMEEAEISWGKHEMRDGNEDGVSVNWCHKKATLVCCRISILNPAGASTARQDGE